MKKTKLLFAVIAGLCILSPTWAAEGVKGDIGSDKVISATKKMAKKNSPAAVMTVMFSTDSKLSHTMGISGTMMNEAIDKLYSDLESNSDFTLCSKKGVFDAIQKVKTKKGFKAAFKAVTEGAEAAVGTVVTSFTWDDDEDETVIRGMTSLNPLQPWVWATVGDYQIMNIDNDFQKQIVKDTKCSSLLFAVIQVCYLEKDDMFKPCVKTSLYLLDKKGELIKKVHALAATDARDMSVFEDDPSILKEEIPVLINKSIELATLNFARKVGALNISDTVVKFESTEVVSDANVPAGVDTDYFFDIKD